MFTKSAKYHLGQIVRHKKHPFRGVVFDVDPEFSNTDEWYESIPEDSRPHKEQPYYHLLAENDHSFYVAYVSEQQRHWAFLYRHIQYCLTCLLKVTCGLY